MFTLIKEMDAWYSLIRTLKDESEDPYATQELAYYIFQDLKRKKIREKVKFKNRMGPEFETWAGYLTERFPETLVKALLNEDDFWTMSLDLTVGS